MAATRLIAMHPRQGRSVAKSLGERTDYAKNPGIQYADEYYTIDQIVNIYRVGKNTVYNAIRHYKVPSLKDGNFGVYLKTAIDKIFKDKKRPEQQ